MKNSNSCMLKRACRQGRTLSSALVLMGLMVLVPQTSHAGVPMPECAKKLFSCAADAAQTLGQSVLTVGNILGHVVANADCVAAMASGSPPAIGVTGLVVGLGAAGVVNPNSCEANIYGTAIVPVGAALDAVLGSDLSSKLSGASLDVAMNLIKPIPVPAVPPTVGGLISCGCGALEAGAKALEDVRKVAKFAAQTYDSCSGAVNSCPGLKQAVAVLKGVYQVFTDPSSIVQDCSSMSRQQYVDARLRDLIGPTRDQFVADIPWQGSNMQVNHWIPRQNTCNKYYDSHCYKEQDAKDFCAAAVYTEVLDPLVWAAIIEAFKGSEFDKYFSATVKDLGLKPVCPADPGISINLDPNQVVSLEQVKGAQSTIAKACNAEMGALISGDTDSLKSLAREMLPTTKAGWVLKPDEYVNEKPLTNAKAVFKRVMTAAAVVTKVKMAAVSARYAAQDTELAKNSEFAAVPYVVLNQKYGQWANVIAKTIQDSCPKDPNGWNGKYDLTCVKELAISVGLSADEAATLKLDGQVVGVIAQAITNGSFKGSRYYNIASNIILNGTPGSPPPIRIRPWTAEKETIISSNRWSAAEAAASLAYAADMPGFFGKQFERVAQDKAKRKTQDDVFAALEKNNKIESDYAAKVCDKLMTGSGMSLTTTLCRGDIDKIAVQEANRFAVSKAGTFLNLNNLAKPGPDAALAKSVTEIKTAHDAASKEFLAVHKQYKVDPDRVVMAGMTRAGSSAGVVKVGLNQGAVNAAVGNAATGAKTGVVGGQPQIGQTVAVVTGSRDSLAVGIAGTGGAPNLKDAKINQGAIGMPGLPQMSRTPPGGIKPPGASDVDFAKGGKTGAPMVVASAVPPIGAGTSAIVNEQILKSGGGGVPPPPPVGTIVSNLPAPGSTAANNIASKLPFDPVFYRKARDKAIADEWYGKCGNQALCLQKMAAVSTKLIDAEVMQLKTGNPDHNDKVAVLAFQNSLDGLFDPQFKAAMPPPNANSPAPTSQEPISSQKPKTIKKLF